MNRKLYSLFLYLLSPIIWLYLLQRGIKDSRYLKGLKQRLGVAPQILLKNSIHIHCASVGETRAAVPLIKQLTQKYPQDNLLITTTTPTGQAEVIKLIKELSNSKLHHCYLPIDWPGACKRFVKQVEPSISILMETELWPNLLHQLSHNDIPILLANGRLSNSSLKKYQKHATLSREIFSNISLIAAQYQSDSLNFQALGVSNENIQLTGSIKFDIQIPEPLLEKQKKLKQQWSKNRIAWIAASIHPAEFEAILTVHRQLLGFFPDLLLIAVPRHPECFEQLKLNCQKQGLNYVSKSENNPPTEKHNLVVGDTMGELTLMYGAAEIAFVGGSLIERGGHNPIEPAACGLPVIMGPSDYNFSDISQIMRTLNALETVKDASRLFETMKKMLSQPSMLETKSLAAKRIFEANRGAVDKIILAVDQLMAKD